VEQLRADHGGHKLDRKGKGLAAEVCSKRFLLSVSPLFCLLCGPAGAVQEDAKMKLHPSCVSGRKLMNTFQFWPLDMDPEGQIYENPAWDLPGLRRRSPAPKKNTKPPARKSKPA
jgi:hypothetical protein